MLTKAVYIGTAALDGAQRLYSFKHIGNYPLIVVVGLATEDVYAEWKRWVIGSAVALLDLLIIVVSAMFAKQLRKRPEMEASFIYLPAPSLTSVGIRRSLDASLDS